MTFQLLALIASLCGGKVSCEQKLIHCVEAAIMDAAVKGHFDQASVAKKIQRTTRAYTHEEAIVGCVKSL